MKAGKLLRNILIGIGGFIVILLVAVEIALRTGMLTPVVNRIAAEFILGDAEFSRVRGSILRRFPGVNVRLDNLSVTYPHSTFSQYDSLCKDTGRFSLSNAGRAEEADTLASLRCLDATLNVLSLLRGRIDVKNLELSGPRIFAHYYDSTAANWNILPLGGGNPDDTVSTGLPDIRIRKVALTDRPFIVFTDPRDTLYGLFTMKQMGLDGDVLIKDPLGSKLDLGIDSLFLSGRLPRDTVALGLDRLSLELKSRKAGLEAAAKVFLATNAFGRMVVPIGIFSKASFPEAEACIPLEVDTLAVNVASLLLHGNASAVLYPDSTYLRAAAGVDQCRIGDLVRDFGDNFPEIRDIPCSATLSLNATADGYFSESSSPMVKALVRIPDGDIYGARANLVATGDDLLGADPLLTLKGKINADVARLTRYFTASMGINGDGELDADIDAAARLSQLSLQGIGNADIDCRVDLSDLTIHDAPDTLDLYVRSAAIKAGTENRTLALRAAIDTVGLELPATWINGRNLNVEARNPADLSGQVKASNLTLMDNTGLALRIKDNTERFRITPSKGKTPMKLSLSSESGRVRVKSGSDFFLLDELSFNASASKHVSSADRRAKRRHILDSLQRVYPGVPRDSLFAYARRSRSVPAWMKEESFRRSDIDLNLGETVAKYMREWDFLGNVALEEGRIFVPAYPLRTVVSDVSGKIDNNNLVLSNVKLQSGQSDVSASATLSGLRRAIGGRGKGQLRLDAAVRSDYIDANELLRAYAYWTEHASEFSDAATVETAVEEVPSSEMPDSITSSPLIVIPGNIVANLSLEANRIKYDSLLVSWAAADIAMRQRTIQITNTVAASNMGDIYLEGFYSTLSKDEIKAGFDLSLVDITAEKVITLIPAVDTLMPLLKTFSGDLDVSLAATSDIDTTMNLVLPTMDGVMRISGKDLTLRPDKDISRIMKIMMFRNSKRAVIDNMYVTAMVRDNTIEIFPFVLDIDRYMLAASGIQHLDESFRYHVSVIRSPLLIKFGINAWGKDFDHVRFGVGRAKYRNPNVPVFTRQLDTVQYSLLSSIHNIFDIGVQKAIEENRNQSYIQSRIDQVGFSSEIDTVEVRGVLDSLTRAQEEYESVLESVEARKEKLREEVVLLEDEAAGVTTGDAYRKEDEQF